MDLFQIMDKLLIPKKNGVTKRKIIVTYNPEELDVEDLCAITPELDTTPGHIEGTNITVTDFEAGRSVYQISNVNKTIVNSVKFRSKISGHSRATYVIE